MTTKIAPELVLPFDPPAGPRQGLGEIASTLVGSEILKIAAQVRTLRESGKTICDLTVGDFSPAEFRIPRELEAGVVKALAAGLTNYPPSDGILELRQAVRAFYERVLGLPYPLEGVLIAGGARPIIWAAFRAVMDAGDTVVYPVPSWNNNHYVHLCRGNGIAVVTRSENGFLPTADELAPHLRGARLLSVNSPLNPAGSGFGRAQLEAITRLVVEENRRRERAGGDERPLFLLYDHIYWLLASAAAPHYTPVGLVPEVAPYTIFVDGISKSFAATGLRVGWTVAPPYIVRRMRDLLGHIGAWAPKPEQVATAELLGQEGLGERLATGLRDGLLERLRALHGGIRSMATSGLPVDALPPAGALYLSARFDLLPQLGSNEAIRVFLLEKAGFAAVPFQAFGLQEENGWFRLSVGAVSVAQIEEALPRVEAAIRGLCAS
ncbi:MAG: aminotransferase class I/II-fold pyridoxal phosphate-dependent enzyme [Acidobacteriota bacterium]